MIKISSGSFNSEMDNYLSKVKKPLAPKKPKKTKLEEEAKEMKAAEDAKDFKVEEKEYYTEKKPFFQKIIDFIAGPDDDEEDIMNKEEKAKEEKEDYEDEKELEEYSEKSSRKGVFSSIRQWFAGDGEKASETKTAEASPQEHAISDDIKEVIKIQNRWLMKLPVKTIKDFKDSEDYRVYKETLRKYNLIKIKE